MTIIRESFLIFLGLILSINVFALNHPTQDNISCLKLQGTHWTGVVQLDNGTDKSTSISIDNVYDVGNNTYVLSGIMDGSLLISEFYESRCVTLKGNSIAIYLSSDNGKQIQADNNKLDLVMLTVRGGWWSFPYYTGIKGGILVKE